MVDLLLEKEVGRHASYAGGVLLWKVLICCTSTLLCGKHTGRSCDRKGTKLGRVERCKGPEGVGRILSIQQRGILNEDGP